MRSIPRIFAYFLTTLGVIALYERYQFLVGVRYSLFSELNFGRSSVCSEFDYGLFTGKKLFISVILRNAAMVFPQWSTGMYEFVQCMTDARAVVAVSIVSDKNYDSTPRYLEALRDRFTKIGVQSIVNTRYKDVSLVDGSMQWIQRLSKLRNASLRNVARFGGLESFDAVVFVNDVLFQASDLARVAGSLSALKSRTPVDYSEPFAGGVCAMDYANYFYDVFVSKGLSGESFFHEYPFISAFDGPSTHLLASRHQKFQGLSCWNGVFAMDAKTLANLGSDSPFRIVRNPWDSRGYFPADVPIVKGQTVTITVAGDESIGSTTEQTLDWYDEGDTLDILLHHKGTEFGLFQTVDASLPPSLVKYTKRTHSKSLFRPLMSSSSDPAMYVRLALQSVKRNESGDPVEISGTVVSETSTTVGAALVDFECDPSAAETIIHKDALVSTRGNYIVLLEPKAKVYYQKEFLLSNAILRDFREFMSLLEQWYVDAFLDSKTFTSIKEGLAIPDEYVLHSKEGRIDRSRLMLCTIEFTGCRHHGPWISAFHIIYFWFFLISLAHAVIRSKTLRLPKLGFTHKMQPTLAGETLDEFD